MSNDYKNHIMMLRQPKFVPASHCWHWQPKEPAPLTRVLRRDYPKVYMALEGVAFAGTLFGIWLMIIVLYV